MDYRSMIETAVKNGGGEKAMWKSVEATNAAMEQIETATQGKKFPDGTTPWDRYVAYNAAYADFSKKFDDEQVLDIAYLFFFADEDWNGKGKVWEYMSLNV